MGLIYDTSVLIDIEKDNVDENIIKRSRGEMVYITSPTFSEFWFGALSLQKKKRNSLQERLERYRLLNTSNRSSKIFAEIKKDLLNKGKAIPEFDILIASIAIDNDFILLTKDKHFSHIDGLKVVDVS